MQRKHVIVSAHTVSQSRSSLQLAVSLNGRPLNAALYVALIPACGVCLI